MVDGQIDDEKQLDLFEFQIDGQYGHVNNYKLLKMNSLF